MCSGAAAVTRSAAILVLEAMACGLDVTLGNQEDLICFVRVTAMKPTVHYTGKSQQGYLPKYTECVMASMRVGL